MKKTKINTSIIKCLGGRVLGGIREDGGSTSRGWGGQCKSNLRGVYTFKGNRRSHVVQIYHHYVGIDLLSKLSHIGAILPSLLFLFSPCSRSSPELGLDRRVIRQWHLGRIFEGRSLG